MCNNEIINVNTIKKNIKGHFSVELQECQTFDNIINKLNSNIKRIPDLNINHVFGFYKKYIL